MLLLLQERYVKGYLHGAWYNIQRDTYSVWCVFLYALRRTQPPGIEKECVSADEGFYYVNTCYGMMLLKAHSYRLG